MIGLEQDSVCEERGDEMVELGQRGTSRQASGESKMRALAKRVGDETRQVAARTISTKTRAPSACIRSIVSRNETRHDH